MDCSGSSAPDHGSHPKHWSRRCLCARSVLSQNHPLLCLQLSSTKDDEQMQPKGGSRVQCVPPGSWDYGMEHGVGVHPPYLPAPGTAGAARGLPEGTGSPFALCWGHQCPFPEPAPLVVTACQTALCCLACISVQLPAVALGPGCAQGTHSIRQQALSAAGGQPVPGTGTGALSVGRGRC